MKNNKCCGSFFDKVGQFLGLTNACDCGKKTVVRKKTKTKVKKKAKK